MEKEKADDFYAAELVSYARSFLGVPYIWGGNGRVPGLDCSGFCVELLRKYCIVGPFEDLSSHGIYEKLRGVGWEIKSPKKAFPTGTFLFYGESLSKIEHVAMSLDFYSIIECGGGNSRTDSVEKAGRLNACVRERSVHFRDDFLKAYMAPWPWMVDSEEDEIRQ